MNTYKSTLALGIKEGIVYKWSQRLPYTQYTKVQREQTLIIHQLNPAFSSQICNDVIKASLLIIPLPANDPLMKTSNKYI